VTEPAALLREPVWERQFGESRQAFAAFQAYRDLGPGRSVDAAYRAARGPHEDHARTTRATKRWRLWTARWRWAERASAWDAHLDDEARLAQEDAVRRDAEALAERRRLQREREIAVGDRLLQRAEEMLQFPLVATSIERETADGRVIQRIEPTAWRVRDAPRLADVGVKLKRLALDMEGPGAETARELGDVLAQAFARLSGTGPRLPPDLADDDRDGDRASPPG
jgi:hypothetical protein